MKKKIINNKNTTYNYNQYYKLFYQLLVIYILVLSHIYLGLKICSQYRT